MSDSILIQYGLAALAAMVGFFGIQLSLKQRRGSAFFSGIVSIFIFISVPVFTSLTGITIEQILGRYIGDPVVRLLGREPAMRSFDESSPNEAVDYNYWRVLAGPRSKSGHVGDSLGTNRIPMFSVSCQLTTAEMMVAFNVKSSTYPQFRDSVGFEVGAKYQVHFDFSNRRVTVPMHGYRKVGPDTEIIGVGGEAPVTENEARLIDQVIQMAFLQELPFRLSISREGRPHWRDSSVINTRGTRSRWIEANDVEAPSRDPRIDHQSDECLKFG
jgi:hypothetical protein